MKNVKKVGQLSKFKLGVLDNRRIREGDVIFFQTLNNGSFKDYFLIVEKVGRSFIIRNKKGDFSFKLKEFLNKKFFMGENFIDIKGNVFEKEEIVELLDRERL